MNQNKKLLNLERNLSFLLILIFFVSSSFNLIAAPAFLEKTDIFKAGENDFALYRIPGIVVTTKGTVLAYCEARRNSSSDWGEIEIYLRRSSDGGKTWEAPKQIAHMGERLPRSTVALKVKKVSEKEQTVN